MNAEMQEPLQRKLSFPFAKRHGVSGARHRQ